jgi:hypothetical protein
MSSVSDARAAAVSAQAAVSASQAALAVAVNTLAAARAAHHLALTGASTQNPADGSPPGRR